MAALDIAPLGFADQGSFKLSERCWDRYRYLSPFLGEGSPDMNIEEQIEAYIAGQPEPKRDEMQELHRLMLRVSPDCKLWFLDGRDSEGKIVSNPNIGYGVQTIKYAGGKTRDFYRIGLSANTAGISIYIIGIEDKTFLAGAYGGRLGKAKITGYCIKFKTLKDINMDILEEVIRFGFKARNERGELG